MSSKFQDIRRDLSLRADLQALNARNWHFFQKKLPGSLVSTQISALH